MKINLAENMIRFGVKNLSKSDTKTVKMLAEQEQKTATAQPIQIKSASGNTYMLTPNVQLTFRTTALIIDFVKNTLTVNGLTTPIDTLDDQRLTFGLVKQIMIAHGAPTTGDASTWLNFFAPAINAIKLFATDKNIPDTIRKAFNGLKFSIETYKSTAASKTLQDLTNNWDDSASKMFGVAKTAKGFFVDQAEGNALYYFMKTKV